MLEKDFVEYVVKIIVQNPDKVKVDLKEKEQTNVLTVTADESDYGRIIGHRGSFINSVRNLLNVVSRNNKKRWVIDIPDRAERN